MRGSSYADLLNVNEEAIPLYRHLRYALKEEELRLHKDLVCMYTPMFR